MARELDPDELDRYKALRRCPSPESRMDSIIYTSIAAPVVAAQVSILEPLG